MPRLLTALALLLLAPLATAQVYKWTDASGTVHYAEAPPPQGTHYSKVTTTGTVEAPADHAAAPAASDDAPPADKKEAASEQPEAAAEPMADTPENRSKLCDTLRANMDTLGGSGPVVMQQDGKNVALDEDQRRQQTVAAQEQFDQYCK